MSKTVKVRVLVRVDSDGEWGCRGWNEAPEGDLRHGLDSEFPGSSANTACYAWLTATLPIPDAEPEEVEAQVEEAE